MFPEKRKYLEGKENEQKKDCSYFKLKRKQILMKRVKQIVQYWCDDVIKGKISWERGGGSSAGYRDCSPSGFSE